MGNDGGSIPTRRELVKEGARDPSTTQVKEIQSEQQEHYWSTCAISHQPLAEPVVSDGLGTLYNKDAVLSHLIEESQTKEGSPLTVIEDKKEVFKQRIKSLRDVVEVKFQTSPSEEGKKWICPVTNKVLGPGTKAIYLVPCGHAFAESLIETVPGDKCLQCEEAYESTNIIQILPTSQEAKDRLTIRLEDLKAQGLTHSLKKAPKDGHSKKRKKAGPLPEDEPEIGGAAGAVTASKPHSNGVKINGSIQNKDTALLTQKVLKEQEERNKRRKVAGNDNVESLFSKGDGLEAKKVDFMTRGYSIPAGGKR